MPSILAQRDILLDYCQNFDSSRTVPETTSNSGMWLLGQVNARLPYTYSRTDAQGNTEPLSFDYSWDSWNLNTVRAIESELKAGYVSCLKLRQDLEKQATNTDLGAIFQYEAVCTDINGTYYGECIEYAGRPAEDCTELSRLSEQEYDYRGFWGAGVERPILLFKEDFCRAANSFGGQP